MRPAHALAIVLLFAAGCVGTPTDVPPPTTPGESTGLSWRAETAAPTERGEVAAARVGDELYVIGGYLATGVAGRTVELLDARSGAWRRASDYPIPIHHTAAVAIGPDGAPDSGTLYVLGGYTTSAFVPTNLAFKYDAAAGIWSPIASLPAARGAHAAAVVDGKAYVVGGVGVGMELMRQVHVYDPASDAWTSAPDLPTGRDHLAAASVGGVLYVVGGREQSLSSNLGTLEAFDPKEGSWKALPGMPTPRGGLAAAPLRGQLAVVGGEESGGTFAEVEAFDPANGTWTRLPDLPTPRHGLAAVEHGGRLYVLVGGRQPGFAGSGVVESLGDART